MYNFEKLEVWQVSVEFANDVYNITKTFPIEERFGLVNQIKRSACSISSNIAEGSARFHEQDFIRFLRIALGSVYECITQFFIAKSQKYITEEEFQLLYDKTTSISKMINALIKSLGSKNVQQPTTNN